MKNFIESIQEEFSKFYFVIIVLLGLLGIGLYMKSIDYRSAFQFLVYSILICYLISAAIVMAKKPKSK